MVSVPLIPSETDPKLVVGFQGNSWAAYRPDSGTYALYGSDPGHLTWFVPPESTPGRGFWARFPSGDTTFPQGAFPSQDQPAAIHLLPGWNIIGNPYLSAATWNLDAITVQVAGNTPKSLRNSRDVVAGYAWGWRPNEANPYTGAYYLVWDPLLKPGVANRLEPWQAFWIKARLECNLILPPP